MIRGRPIDALPAAHSDKAVREMMHLTSKLHPALRVGGPFTLVRQQPALSARWRHRVQADVNIDSAVAQDSLSGATRLSCRLLAHRLYQSALGMQ